MKIKLLGFAAALAAVLSSPAGGSGSATPQSEARSAALGWLALVDAGDYARSWSEGAEYFRKSVPQSEWIRSVSQVRGPLGGLKSRRLLSAEYARRLPGAPDGEYFVLQFRTSFEQRAGLTETVTPMKDPDGHWRVSGYYVRVRPPDQ